MKLKGKERLRKTSNYWKETLLKRKEALSSTKQIDAENIMILTFFILALATTSSMISFLLLGLSSFYDVTTTRNTHKINLGEIAVK